MPKPFRLKKWLVAAGSADGREYHLDDERGDKRQGPGEPRRQQSPRRATSPDRPEDR